jgi:ankyrin repeat protein
VRVFLAAGAHVNARDGSGQTPLWIATRSPGESLEAVKLLISAGAEVDIKNGYSESIFYTSMMTSDIRNTLLQHRERAQPQKKSWFKRLLERGSR